MPGQFDYYLLSMSWSPTYCLAHAEDRLQCGQRGLGLVLHGLWPEYESGRYPEHCGGEQYLPEDAYRLGRTLYPTAALMRHEWQSHGTCSGLQALDYFKTADRALAALRLPPILEAPTHDLRLTPPEIAAAFRAANPLLPGDGIRLACNRGQLAEVRVCLSRELALRSCGHAVRGNCPDSKVLVRSAR